MPPEHGSYAGVMPIGLVTSMDLPGDAYGRARFSAGRLDSIPLLTLEIDGKVVDSATVQRWFLAPGVRARDISQGRVRGRLFLPPAPGRYPGVLVLGGSEGGMGGADVAALLASKGFAAFAVAYFALDSLPAELVRIPLEYFGSALDILADEPHVDAKRLGIVGTSKGAEAALLVATREPRLRAVVAFAPSAVSWSCICAEGDAPSWTVGTRPVPYVPPGLDPTYRPPPGIPLRPAVHFRYRVRDAQVVSHAVIPVEHLTAELLLISGADDALWPSQWSGDQIVQTLRHLRGSPRYEHWCLLVPVT